MLQMKSERNSPGAEIDTTVYEDMCDIRVDDESLILDQGQADDWAKAFYGGALPPQYLRMVKNELDPSKNIECARIPQDEPVSRIEGGEESAEKALHVILKELRQYHNPEIWVGGFRDLMAAAESAQNTVGLEQLKSQVRLIPKKISLMEAQVINVEKVLQIANGHGNWSAEFQKVLPSLGKNLIEIQQITSSANDVISFLEKNPVDALITDTYFALAQSHMDMSQGIPISKLVHGLHIDADNFSKVWLELAQYNMVRPDPFSNLGNFRQAINYSLVKEVRVRFPKTKVISVHPGNANQGAHENGDKDKTGPHLHLPFQPDSQYLIYFTLKIIEKSFSQESSIPRSTP